jgi:hypothetical protein
MKTYVDVMTVLGKAAGMTDEEIAEAYDSGELTAGMDEQSLIKSMLQVMKDATIKAARDNAPEGLDEFAIIRAGECEFIDKLRDFFSKRHDSHTVTTIIWYAMRELD